MPLARHDTIAAALVALALQVDLWFVEPAGGPGAVTVASALVFAGSLAWRRRSPRTMIALASAALVVGAALGGQLTETLSVAATAMVIVFSAASHLGPRESAIAAGLFLLATWMDLVLARSADPVLSDLAFTSMIIVPGPYFAGRALRDRRLRTEELERLTEQLREEQAARAQVAVLDERARIAREMHDVVAHSVSLMVVQTGAARSLLDQDLEQSRAALHAAEHAGREALAELRRALGVMRGEADGGDPVSLTPQPGLDQLDELIDRTAQAGLPVSLEASGERRPLSPGADLAVYRIVQEALTNTMKHAGPARATVVLRWLARELAVEVTDTGRGSQGPSGPGSHGLVGMRERVAVYGGSVEASNAPGGGFRVHARFTLTGEA